LVQYKIPLSKRRLAELTASEMRRLVPHRPVILPLGSHQDQGPLTPPGDLSAKAVALRAADRATAGTETCVARVQPFGGADDFGSMPGGISRHD